MWNCCLFNNCELSDLIAPQSRFIHCVFEEVEVDGFQLSQTIFHECTFRSGSVRGLVTTKIGNRSRMLPEIVAKGATALFQKCHFEKSTFTGCRFNDVCFEDCKVEDTQFGYCAFEDVISRDTWLDDFQSGDPFMAFLEAAISAIRSKLGSDCQSVRALENFKESYSSKRANSKDYSAVLFDRKVSDNELDVVEKILDKISVSFPF